MNAEKDDVGLPVRYTRDGRLSRLTAGRGDDAMERLARGYRTATSRVPDWLSAADLDEAELTRRARDRLVERQRRRRDEHIEAERRRRAEYGAGYRMVPPPPIDASPKPTSREVTAERRRARFSRWAAVLGAALVAPQVLFAAPLGMWGPVLLAAAGVGVVGYLWTVGGPNPEPAEPEAAAAAPPAAAQAGAVDAAPCDAGPSVSLLKTGIASGDDGSDAARTTQILDTLLSEHGIDASVTGHARGPTVTRYLLTLGTGVRNAKVTALAADIGRAAACEHEPWIGPVPGDTRLAVELPNAVRDDVLLGEVLREADLTGAGPLAVGLGRDIDGAAVTCDLAAMPHLLVGGATGAGKSVFLNALICSPLVRGVGPDRLRMILIDPKQVELAAYGSIPHLLRPIVTDAQRAVDALGWVASEGGEMDRRYALLKANGVRNIAAFNERAASGRAVGLDGQPCGPVPYLLAVIDELADLVLIAKDDVETHVVRATQLARAAGIHLVVATQRPSVDVVTGLIKANMPSRLAFATASGTDSRVVLDELGAQCLLGRGDALFKPIGAKSARRLQAALITDAEIDAVVAAWRDAQPGASADAHPAAPPRMRPDAPGAAGADAPGAHADARTDAVAEDPELLKEAARLVIATQFGSTSMLRRKLRIRHARAAALMDALEAAQIVGPAEGNNARDVLTSPDDLPTALARLTSEVTT